jgi:hypothetical protein
MESSGDLMTMLKDLTMQEAIIDDYIKVNRAARMCGIPYQRMPHDVLANEDNEHFKKVVMDYMTAIVAYAFTMTGNENFKIDGDSAMYQNTRKLSERAQLGIIFTKEGWH